MEFIINGENKIFESTSAHKNKTYIKKSYIIIYKMNKKGKLDPATIAIIVIIILLVIWFIMRLRGGWNREENHRTSSENIVLGICIILNISNNWTGT